MSKKLFGNSSSGRYLSHRDEQEPIAGQEPELEDISDLLNHDIFRESPPASQNGEKPAQPRSAHRPARDDSRQAAAMPAGRPEHAAGTGRSPARSASSPRQEQPDSRQSRPHTRTAGKKRRPRRAWSIVLSILLVGEILYCLFAFSNIPIFMLLRNTWIRTALGTMNHQWLATYFLPADKVAEVEAVIRDVRKAQEGVNSNWGTQPGSQTTKPTDSTASTKPTEPGETVDPDAQAKSDFFQLFWELDPDSMTEYLKEHPDALSNGWDKIKINEAGLDDSGTSIRTTMGEQVLAIDAEQQVLLVRVTGSSTVGGYRGVLAIAKDPKRLSLVASDGIGGYGQVAGTIASNNNGLLAITASGFIDPNGNGNGGDLAGYCMCEGVEYGKHYLGGYKRVEFRTDHRMYIVDCYDSVNKDTTDAVEFTPALIVDGKIVVSYADGYYEMNPRTCIGQSSREEILMLAIEGRSFTSIGTDTMVCADILARHDCYQAINLDGGSSTMMWYDGEPIIRCANGSYDGRYLPNAWVYRKK